MFCFVLTDIFHSFPTRGSPWFLVQSDLDGEGQGCLRHLVTLGFYRVVLLPTVWELTLGSYFMPCPLPTSTQPESLRPRVCSAEFQLSASGGEEQGLESEFRTCRPQGTRGLLLAISEMPQKQRSLQGERRDSHWKSRPRCPPFPCPSGPTQGDLVVCRLTRRSYT